MRPSPRVEHIMGMPIVIDLRDDGVDPGATERAFDWLRRVDALFSTYRADSEISRLNQGELALGDADPDVRAVLARCEELRVETDGYFDARASVIIGAGSDGPLAPPGAIDPSGLVKGWAVDRAAGYLDAAGARNYCINAGGDMRLRGGALPAQCWRIGIQHPYVRDRVATVVTATDAAIATSGAYERGQHIVDPHTGRAPSGVLSVTVIGPDLATADACATAIYAMGRAGPEWSARLTGAGYETMTILDDDTVLFTPDFPSI